MKNLIISVSVLLVLVASTVGIRIYLRGVTEDFLSSVERVETDSENERDEFARFSSDFAKKKKTLAFFVHGDYIADAEEKISCISDLYEHGSDAEEIRDALAGLSVAIGNIYTAHSVSADTVF